jgi:hypothetical protein
MSGCLIYLVVYGVTTFLKAFLGVRLFFCKTILCTDGFLHLIAHCFTSGHHGSQCWARFWTLDSIQDQCEKIQDSHT